MLTKCEIEIRVVVKVGSKTIKFRRNSKWYKQLAGIFEQSGKVESKNKKFKEQINLKKMQMVQTIRENV